jgi:hypothetical protein
MAHELGTFKVKTSNCVRQSPLSHLREPFEAAWLPNFCAIDLE